MRELKKIGVVFALALTVAMSGTNAKTVMAAEEAVVTEVVEEVASEETVTTEVVTSEETVTTEVVTSEEAVTTEVVEEVVTSEEAVTTEVVEEVVTSEEAVTTEATENEPVVACEPVALMSLYEEPATVSEENVTLKDAYGYTTWTKENYFDPETKKNEVRLEGEEGEELSTFFKVNFIGANTTEFVNGENLTSYCTNLPSGLEIIKYTNNNTVNMMRVELKGTAQAGNYDVVFTVPTEKLVAKEGYQIPEKGISVTIYLTVNGHLIPVTVPAPTPAPEHNHSYHWDVTRAATESQDGEEVYRCDCGHVEAVRTISAFGLWLDSVEQQILNAEENAVVEVKTEIWNTYNKDIMNALSKRSDVTLVTTFGVGEEAVTFTIPAGACTLIEDEATALAGSVEDAMGTASVQEETQWFGYQFLSSTYNN